MNKFQSRNFDKFDRRVLPALQVRQGMRLQVSPSNLRTGVLPSVPSGRIFNAQVTRVSLGVDSVIVSVDVAGLGVHNFSIKPGSKLAVGVKVYS
jgi:hypothetical protein